MAIEMWTVTVDGLCYGFFPCALDTIQWVADEFPIAFAQNCYTIAEFCSVTIVPVGESK